MTFLRVVFSMLVLVCFAYFSQLRNIIGAQRDVSLLLLFYLIKECRFCAQNFKKVQTGDPVFRILGRCHVP